MAQLRTVGGEPEYDPPLDAGIAQAVVALRAGGVETFESCEGGPGHAYPEPTVLRVYIEPAEDVLQEYEAVEGAPSVMGII